MSNSADGLGPLVLCMIVAGFIVTVLSGSYFLWLFIIAGILGGLAAASSIH